MSVLKFAKFAMGMSVMLSLPRVANADPITLNPGSQIFVRAWDADVFPEKSVTDPVSGLPFLKTTTITEVASLSSIDSTLSTAGFNFNYTQTIGNAGQTQGTADIKFKAGDSVSYSLAGRLVATGSNVSVLNVTLRDVSKGTYLVNFLKISNTLSTPDLNLRTTLQLDDSSGSLTGQLIAGDDYVLHAEENMGNLFADPSLTGNIALTFGQTPLVGGGSGVPLPPAAYTSLGLLLTLGGLYRCNRPLSTACSD